MSELDQTLSEAVAETRLFVESTVDLDADLLATLARSRVTASAMEPAPSSPSRGAHIALATAAALVALLVGVLTVIDRGDSGVEPAGTISPSPSRTLPAASTIVESPIVPASTVARATSTGSTSAGDGSAFAAAIEVSGVLTSPSADEAAQATDALFEANTGPTAVSATGNHVSLQCRVEMFSPCGTGWVYMTGAAEGDEVHGGLLGEASHLDLHLLDDRYFVASETLPDSQTPSTAWLIDAVTGKAGALRSSDEPTTLNSPEQALLLCQESYEMFGMPCVAARGPDAPDGGYTFLPTDAGLPMVVDARDGTIRPLAMPDNVEARLPVAQHGTGRIWVGTAPDGDGLGLAYSDDGGATWTDVALPQQMRAGSAEVRGATSAELATSASNGFKLLEIAADGDRVALAASWGPKGRAVYVSDDAGRSWTTATPSEPQAYANGAHLYVLADGRLVLMWSSDPFPVQLLVSTGSDWTKLDKVDRHFLNLEAQSDFQHFSVNSAGIALVRSFHEACPTGPCSEVVLRGGEELETGPALDTIEFSSDLTNWSTIDFLDD